jgi:hypothetical protein
MSAALASRQNQAPLPSVEARQALSTPAVQCNEREENGNSLRLRSIVTDFNKHLCSLLISPDETNAEQKKHVERTSPSGRMVD